MQLKDLEKLEKVDQAEDYPVKLNHLIKHALKFLLIL